MDEFEKIIKEDVYLFDKKFKEVLSTNTSILYKITNYIRKNSGKRIRPICCLIASGLVNNITEKTFRGAILIELLHTATLIHDSGYLTIKTDVGSAGVIISPVVSPWALPLAGGGKLRRRLACSFGGCP